MQPPQQSMGSPPYYGYPQPQAAMAPMVIKKRFILVGIAIAVLLLWIAELGLHSFGVNDLGTIKALRAIYYTGAGFGLLTCVAGALGSPRTDGYQNVGLLVLAGFFTIALIGGIL